MFITTATNSFIFRQTPLARRLRYDVMRYVLLPAVLIALIVSMVLTLNDVMISSVQLFEIAVMSLVYASAAQMTHIMNFDLWFPAWAAVVIAMGYIFLGFLLGMTFGFMEVIFDDIHVPEYAILRAFVKGLFFGVFLVSFRAMISLLLSERRERIRHSKGATEQYEEMYYSRQ